MTDEELVAAYLRERDVPCPGCGYNLRGMGGRVCPECGETVRLQLVRTGMVADDPAAERVRLTEYLLDRDVPCPACGTNLRGHDDVACPRCGYRLSTWMLKPRGLAGAGGARRSIGILAVLALLAVLWAVVMLKLLMP